MSPVMVNMVTSVGFTIMWETSLWPCLWGVPHCGCFLRAVTHVGRPFLKEGTQVCELGSLMQQRGRGMPHPRVLSLLPDFGQCHKLLHTPVVTPFLPRLAGTSN